MTLPGGVELLILVAVLVALFGAQKLPAAARSLGQSLRVFKAEFRGSSSNRPETTGADDAGARPVEDEPRPRGVEGRPPSGPG